MDIDTLLKICIDKKASDLHLRVGCIPMARVNGDLSPLSQFGKFNPDELTSLLYSVMNPERIKRYEEHHEADFAYNLPGMGRFRVNVYQQRGTISSVFRLVPMSILSIMELNLPQVIERISMEPRGLIMVTGTTGSGKSTALAAMVDHINKNKTVNIITIEDPIEFLHRDRKGTISQREIGTDTESFSAALRAALRQDPDVILVGEMRDFETISTALAAAETGHLVLSTLHTVDAVETINRIIMIFPPYQQKQIRLQLASIIKGIISMRLVPRGDGKGRIPAVEVMVSTQTIREAIIDPDKTRRVHDSIAAGVSQYGMQTFDQSLYGLYKKSLISYDEARKWATNPDDFALRAKGIQASGESWETAVES